MDIQPTPPITELSYRRPSVRVTRAADEPTHIHIPRPSRVAQDLVSVGLDDTGLITQLAMDEAEAA